MATKGLDYPPPPPRGGDDEFLSSPDPLEKNRRAFAKIGQGSDEPAVQVETKPGRAWTEPELSAPAGRERKKQEASGDTEPPIQVETKTAPSDDVEVKPPQLPEEISRWMATPGVLPIPAQTDEEEALPVEKEKRPITRNEARDFFTELVNGKAEVKTFKLTTTPEGLMMHVDLYTFKTGNIELNGTLVNDTNTIGVEGLSVKSDRFTEQAREAFEQNLSGLGVAIKTHFEKQFGKPVSSVQIGESGLVAELEPPSIITEPDGRIEPELGPEVEQQEDTNTQQEGTPKENRSRFLEVMARAKEKFGWYSSSEEHLIRQNEELDAQMEAIGGKLKIERGFRWIGEKYNKLPFKYKLALGATLGLGTVLSAGTLAVAFPLLGIAGQRAAGLASMYMKFEKQSHDEAWGKNKEWGKQKAMLKAGVYTVLIGLTMKEAIEYASETEIAHAAQAKVEGFLGYMMGHTVSPSVVSAPAEAPTHVASPSTPEAHVASPAPEGAPPAVTEAPAAAEAATPEMPAIMIHASSGRGYEYMLKRMWEDLQERQLDPSKYGENSDIHKLLTADAGNIDKVVHDIASDPQHGFFNPDGARSAVIRPTDILTVGANGQVLLITPDDVIAHAPVGGPTTPAYHPSAVEQQAPLPDGIVPPDTSPAALDDQEIVPTQEESPAYPPLERVEVVAPEPIKTVEITHEQDVADSENAVMHSESVSEAPTFMTKVDGVLIDPRTPAIYQAQLPTGETYLAAYGGSDDERLKFIQEYLMRPENQGQTIRFAHEVPSIFGSQVKVDEIGAGTNAGQTSWLLDFFKKPVSPPAPETFLKKLSK